MFNPVIAALLIGSLASSANAATLTARLAETGTIILLKGDIARDDSQTLANLIRAADADGYAVRGLQLDSPGGNLLGGMSLARLIHDHPELSATIAPGATCASACFLAFAAARAKAASYESLVGVHGVTDKSGQVTGETEAATLAMARFCRELGVPAPITEKLIATPPDEIVWLSAEDLRSMGVTMAGRPLQPERAGLRDIAQDRQDRAGEALDPRVTKLESKSQSKSQADLVRRALDAAERADYAMAVKVWHILAAQGHAASQYNLGQMYYAGQGVAQDFALAVKWYRAAAEKGIPGAQLSLGLAYALGRGVPQDLAQAYKWLGLAKEGYANERERAQALKAQALIAARMTPSEAAEAEQQAHDWSLLRRNGGLAD